MSAIVKALDKIEEGQESRGLCAEAAEGDIEFKDGKFTVAARQVGAWAMSRSTPYRDKFVAPIWSRA